MVTRSSCSYATWENEDTWEILNFDDRDWPPAARLGEMKKRGDGGLATVHISMRQRQCGLEPILPWSWLAEP
jgi:hypothetical protein